MISEIVSVLCGKDGPDLAGVPVHDLYDNRANRKSPCECYQALLDHCISDVIIYVHDDVTIHDPDWLKRVTHTFAVNLDCVAVGLGGALTLGRRDLYRKPYDIWAMARGNYASNQTDAEVHGARFNGTRRVAVLDAFFMAIRTDWLRRLGNGGWPVEHLTHHCLDLWLACEAARDQKEIWMTGIDCTHHGGGSSAGRSYPTARWLQGGTMQSDHQIPHRWLYEEYRDVLPVEVGE